MIPSALTAQLQQGLADFLRYSFWSSTPGMEHVIEDLIDAPGGVTHGPYLSVKLPFASGSKRNFFTDVPLGFTPHAHQERAFERLGGKEKRSTLVATGTGSGKTECFLLPILQHCAETANEPGIKAILIYPMNALATDQAERIARLIYDNPKLRGRVTAGLYIGESKGKKRTAEEGMGPRHIVTDRDVMEKSPPHILLTNYKMLDLLMLRPWVQGIWRHNRRGDLRYLVVDELHTFDGAQGTDLACLIRRLKRLLQVDDGSLCCVGTSATLGGAGAKKQLLDYAGQVFGEPFDDGALIGESRLDAPGFLAGADATFTDEPDLSDLDALAAERYDDSETWLREQVRLWFGGVHETADPESWAVELGERLRCHAAFRALLGLLDGHVVGLGDAVQSLSRARTSWRQSPHLGRAALLSLLGLVSAARRRVEVSPGVFETTRFLDVRIQLWQREMARMVATVTQRPRLRFSDDLDKEQKREHLPLAQCRDCGAMGWGTRIDKNKPHVLRCEPSAFYSAFFRNDDRVVFLYPAAAIPPGDPVWESRRVRRVDSKNLVILQDDEEPGGEVVELVEVKNVRQTDSGPVLHRDCPFCDARESLALLGFRAATLTSAYIDQMFASRFNDERDKKVLAFSDSVQDAAHRAGFFSARTWHTNLRVGISRVLCDGHDGATLAELSDAFVRYWQKKLDPQTWIATFLAPNMNWLHDWDALQRDGKLPVGSDLPALVAKRLAFELVNEFGLQATIGRSLPRTKAATAYIDREKLDETCAMLLEPLRNEVPGLKGATLAQVRAFVLGVLHHLRLRGGILSAEIPEEYLKTAGDKTFMFNISPHLPSFAKTSRMFAFITDRPGKRRFDSWFESASKHSGWYERWLSRCFTHDAALGADAPSAYPPALAALTAKGLLAEIEAASKTRVWGIPESALCVTRDVVTVHCAKCDHRQVVARVEAEDWLSAPCATARCDGRYEVEEQTRPDYFGRLYAHGDLQRIYTAEHTGLLTREERELVERQFKAETRATDGNGEEGGASISRRPWYPNLLSCTPTLEMGIDIGDLSSTVLCTVPPTQASYLQRIGRAGRREGNSFVLTVANARPHDLYFYAAPEEMMEGDVLPPGVFLDASAVLERQLTAFCFDRWVASEGDKAVLPAHLKDVLSRIGDRGGTHFPHNLLAFIEREQPTILREFDEMFAGRISPTTRAHLRAFLVGDEANKAGLGWRLLDTFAREKKQLDSFQAKARQLSAEIKKLEASETKPQDYEDRLGKLEDEKEALQGLINGIKGSGNSASGHAPGRQTLEFLTDEGLLPNYAFPETAVRLRSVIWRRKKRVSSQGSKYDTWTYEYARSPSSALSEFAPHADFYAGGRHVKIDQVDVTMSEIETWRFCAACNHAQRDDIGEKSFSCPACGSTAWADDEQKLRLLPLKQVFASAPDRESRIRDERDERQPRHFLRQILVDHHDVDREAAWSLDEPSLPFGFELLRRATFRELNFGVNIDQGPRTDIAGKNAARPGFRICTRCGKVQPDHSPSEHAPACPTKTRGEKESVEPCLYLYREFSSEALRFLLPMADVGTRLQLNSFLAALQLGLRERFGGSVEHIKTTVYSEPDRASSLRRQYLVLFDSVPGGTGYVKQLVTPPAEGGVLPIREVLELARKRIESCTCWTDPERDGCYRCLLAYRNAKEMDDTSAHEAVQLIGKILSRWDKLKPIPSLGDVSVSGLMDSVLEARFIEALKQTSYGGHPNRVKHAVFRQKPCYHLTVGEQEWYVEPQCDVDHADSFGIVYPVDFVLWPAGHATAEKRDPIAVFLDGFEFHKGRVGLDMSQRQRMLASGSWDVWSLTWFDLDEALGTRRPDNKPVNLVHANLQELRDRLQAFGLGAYRDWGERPIFDLFLADIGDVALVPWKQLGEGMLASRMTPAQPDSGTVWAAAVRQMAPMPVRPLLDIATCKLQLADDGALNPWVSVHAVHDGQNVKLLAQLDDRPDNREQPGFREAWNGYLRLFQLLRQVPGGWFFTRTGNEEFDSVPLIQLRSGPAEGAPWSTLNVGRAFVPLCEELQSAGVDKPEVGLDIPNAGGGVWAEGELVWEDRRIAVTDKARIGDAVGEVALGWKVFAVEDLASIDPLLAALKTEGGA
ncbi:MAG: DEAD/DEAH box helicase [Deltaproteobacteria bacterium]|nr:DEAD/DEAH box helicase [Deltaproteobacteria bacterium]